jgi:hypothetical protein
VDTNAQSSASWIVFLVKYFPRNQIKENEVGEVCDACGSLQELRTWVWWGNLKGMEHLKELSVDWRVILSGI